MLGSVFLIDHTTRDMSNSNIPKPISQMVDDVNAVKGEPRSTVLIVQLYIEYIIDEILNKKFSKSKKILKFRFDDKLSLLVGLNLLSNELSEDLKIFYDIRNLFAHRLAINSSTFDKELISKLNAIKVTKQVDFTKIQGSGRLTIIALRLIHELWGIYETS